MNDVEKEIVAAAKFDTKKKFKNRQAYLVALREAVDGGMTDDEFNSLSEGAFAWYNESALAMHEDRDIGDFDQYTPEAEQAKKEAPAKKAKPTLKKTKSAAKPAKPEKAPKEAKAKSKKPKLSIDYDKYQFKVNSKRHAAAAMFEKTTTMEEVVTQLGGNGFYNMLRSLSARGHKVDRDGKMITLTYVQSEE